MAKQQGQVLVRVWKTGRGFALRFRAYGKRWYLTLGLERDGWTKQRAEEELANILADVRRGIWTPPARKKPSLESRANPVGDVPRFANFATDLIETRRAEVSERTYEYLQWTLSHLLPYFGPLRLSEIDIETVDNYRAHKLEESERRQRAIDRLRPLTDPDDRVLRPLAARSINKTIETLQSVLAIAVEYGHLASNPAAGKRRRIKLPPRRCGYIDTVEQIEALLDAATQLDQTRRWRTNDRRAIIATLLFAGLRASELCQLLWRDIDLPNSRIHISRSKTQAGLRTIHTLSILRNELVAHKIHSYRAEPDDPVFPTGTGGRRDKDNLRNRILAATTKHADDLLAQRGHVPLPANVSPHKLRHTYASILVACGKDPATVMAQLGHTDPKFTLRIYTHLMHLDTSQCERLVSLVEGASS